MKNTNSIWKYWIECECHTEGIMIGYDNADPFPTLDLAIFSHGKFKNDRLSLKEKLRYCWHLLRTGQPFMDDVMLRQETARELANHLLEFANKKYPIEDKK